MQTATRQTKAILYYSREERRIHTELKRRIDQMGAEERSVLLIMAREITEPGTMHGLLFGVGRIDL